MIPFPPDVDVLWFVATPIVAGAIWFAWVVLRPHRRWLRRSDDWSPYRSDTDDVGD